MTAAMPKKTIDLKIDDPLYSLLERQAGESGEGLNDLIQRLLCESMDSWCEYCEAVRQLSEEDERPLLVSIEKAV